MNPNHAGLQLVIRVFLDLYWDPLFEGFLIRVWGKCESWQVPVLMRLAPTLCSVGWWWEGHPFQDPQIAGLWPGAWWVWLPPGPWEGCYLVTACSPLGKIGPLLWPRGARTKILAVSGSRAQFEICRPGSGSTIGHVSHQVPGWAGLVPTCLEGSVLSTGPCRELLRRGGVCLPHGPSVSRPACGPQMEGLASSVGPFQHPWGLLRGLWILADNDCEEGEVGPFRISGGADGALW